MGCPQFLVIMVFVFGRPWCACGWCGLFGVAPHLTTGAQRVSARGQTAAMDFLFCFLKTRDKRKMLHSVKRKTQQQRRTPSAAALHTRTRRRRRRRVSRCHVCPSPAGSCGAALTRGRGHGRARPMLLEDKYGVADAALGARCSRALPQRARSARSWIWWSSSAPPALKSGSSARRRAAS